MVKPFATTLIGDFDGSKRVFVRINGDDLTIRKSHSKQELKVSLTNLVRCILENYEIDTVIEAVGVRCEWCQTMFYHQSCGPICKSEYGHLDTGFCSPQCYNQYVKYNPKKTSGAKPPRALNEEKPTPTYRNQAVKDVWY